MSGSYNFPTLTWERFNATYDEQDPPQLVSYLWNIVYVLEREQYGTNSGCYYAEADQLPEEPTQEDIEELILSLFPEGARSA